MVSVVVCSLLVTYPIAWWPHAGMLPGASLDQWRASLCKIMFQQLHREWKFPNMTANPLHLGAPKLKRTLCAAVQQLLYVSRVELLGKFGPRVPLLEA